MLLAQAGDLLDEQTAHRVSHTDRTDRRRRFRQSDQTDCAAYVRLIEHHALKAVARLLPKRPAHHGHIGT